VLRVAKIVAFLAALEAIFWLFGTLSLHRGNPWRLFDAASLSAEIEANLPTERSAPATGWPAPDARIERPHPPLPTTSRCGSAWGGSFTVGADVSDAEAWPYLASVKLGCKIANFGVDGFGFDQTMLLAEAEMPHNSLIILGMAQPMITVGGASSWTFIDLRNHQPQAKITKPFFLLTNNELQLERRPAADQPSIMAHYIKDDYGSRWTPFRFPFTAAVSLALYRKFSLPDLLKFGPMADLPELAKQRELANATITAVAASAERRGNRFAVLLIPRPEDAANPSSAFAAMFRALADRMPPSVCMIDPSAALQSLAASLEHPNDLLTKTAHFSAAGNAVLADELVRGLRDCRIVP